MNLITAEQLLLVWDQGHEYSLLQKSLMLLELVTPEYESTNAALLSIGQRDTRLIQLRNYLFGSTLHNAANCPVCNSKMEWDMDLHDLIIQESDIPESSTEHVFQVDDYRVRFRLPNSIDILQILSETSDELKTQSLIKHCILEIKAVKDNREVKSIPENIIKLLSEKIPELDPAADITMHITCPACGYDWEAIFDIMSYLWSEIDRWVQKTLHEVYLLASAFGWSEKDILNMDIRRRQIYIEMITS